MGCFKDETGGIPIKQFIGLRSKMYSYIYEDNQNKLITKKTSKGTPKSSLQNKISFENYENVLNFPAKLYLSSHLIRSTKHQLYTCYMNKLSLCPFDDKRFILPNGSDTLAHGHYLIPFLLKILKDIWHS